MRFRFLLLALGWLIHLPGYSQTFVYHRDYARLAKEATNPGSPGYYPALLQQFRANASLTDPQVWALMAGYTSQPDFAPYKDLDTERHLYRLNDEKQYQQVLDEADPFIHRHPLSLQGLLEKSYAHHKLAQPDSSEHYLRQYKRLIEAMAASGDGLSAETAIFTIGPTDGQVFISRYRGRKLGSMGSGRDKQGNFLDILSVQGREGSAESGYDMYFQIQPASSTMLRELRQKTR
ncbi:hypothetical protein GCM10022409_22680 [Hymenobacter glaciei]|uniref:DUF4919 domain-containing protein n=1 Tax=Hymenobacter glaciei TaxID=877209 RepID=A0ABP7U772_9BACT